MKWLEISKFELLVSIVVSILAGFFTFLVIMAFLPKTFSVSPEEIANLAGNVEPMETTPGTSDEACWIQGFYNEGFIGVCKNLSESLVTLALYSYEGLPVSDFFVVTQKEQLRYLAELDPFYPGYVKEYFIHKYIPGLTTVESPQIIKSGRMSFYRGDLKLSQSGYSLWDGKELWFGGSYACKTSCQSFVLVNDHDFMVVGHHRHFSMNNHTAIRAVIGDSIYFIFGNDILVYEKGSSQLRIQEINFSHQLQFTGRQGSTSCRFEFIGLTNVMYHPLDIPDYRELELGLSQDYLVKAQVLVVRITSGQYAGQLVIFGNDTYAAYAVEGDDYYFDIKLAPTVARELPDLIGHTNDLLVFNSPSGSVLFRMWRHSSDTVYLYYDSQEICNPQAFAPTTWLQQYMPIIGA